MACDCEIFKRFICISKVPDTEDYYSAHLMLTTREFIGRGKTLKLALAYLFQGIDEWMKNKEEGGDKGMSGG